MNSDWMKVMLDEIARKKAEADEARIELERRRAEREIQPRPSSDRTSRPR